MVSFITETSMGVGVGIEVCVGVGDGVNVEVGAGVDVDVGVDVGSGVAGTHAAVTTTIANNVAKNCDLLMTDFIVPPFCCVGRIAT
jgi:uncharacterized alkaline shock family protein YloU